VYQFFNVPSTFLTIYERPFQRGLLPFEIGDGFPATGEVKSIFLFASGSGEERARAFLPLLAESCSAEIFRRGNLTCPGLDGTFAKTVRASLPCLIRNHQFVLEVALFSVVQRQTTPMS